MAKIGSTVELCMHFCYTEHVHVYCIGMYSYMGDLSFYCYRSFRFVCNFYGEMFIFLFFMTSNASPELPVGLRRETKRRGKGKDMRGEEDERRETANEKLLCK